MSHQRRLWFLLVSRNSQVQSLDPHTRTTLSFSEVNKSAADLATCQSSASRACSLPTQSHVKLFVFARMHVWLMALESIVFSMSKSASAGEESAAIAENMR